MPIIGYNNPDYVRNRNELYGLTANQYIGLRDEVVTPDPKQETVETEQVFSEKGIPGGKIGPIVDTGNAGITSVGDTDDSIRFWAGDTYANRATAPFRVNKLGQVFMEDAFIDGYRIFGATVAADGTGDYATLGAAITAGENNVFIKNGDYTGSTESITLSSGTTIIGESRDGVLLDASISISGTSRTLAGTVTLVNGDATVEGAGVNFALASAGDYIEIDDQLYEIESITDSDTLELTQPYIGAGGAGFSIWIYTPIKQIDISNVTFKNSAARAVVMQYCDEIYVHKCRFEGSYLTTSGHVAGIGPTWHTKIENNWFFNSKGGAIYFAYFDSSSISGNVLNHTGYATSIIYNIYVSGARNSSIHSNIIAPSYTSSTNGVAILIGGTHLSVIGNIIEGKTVIYTGVSMTTGGSYCIVSNNIVKGCSNVGINPGGDNNVITGNVVTSNATGVLIAATADRTVVVGNQIYNNTGTNYSNLGTNTTATGNVTA